MLYIYTICMATISMLAGYLIISNKPKSPLSGRYMIAGHLPDIVRTLILSGATGGEVIAMTAL